PVGSHETLAVRAEQDAWIEGGIVVPLRGTAERQHLLAGLRIPELDEIATDAGQAPAVGAERQSADGRRRDQRQRGQWLGGGRGPLPDTAGRGVESGGGEAFAVAAEGEGGNVAAMGRHFEAAPAARPVDNAEPTGLAAERQAVAIGVEVHAEDRA